MDKTDGARAVQISDGLALAKRIADALGLARVPYVETCARATLAEEQSQVQRAFRELGRVTYLAANPKEAKKILSQTEQAEQASIEAEVRALVLLYM